MPNTGIEPFIKNLRRVALRHDGAGITDGQLLDKFVSEHDEAAFEALVLRHGSMVWGVCQRLLRNPHDSEDAFQATFIVLARKAASVLPREMIGNWLYGVAHTTALRSKAAAAKQRVRERQVIAMPEPMPRDNGLSPDLVALLDQELKTLPDRIRTAIVLCDLEGRRRREVARQLKIPEGTLSSRLTTGRKLLARKLARHGVVLSAGAIATILLQSTASACMPATLVGSTVKAATLAAAGEAATSALVSAKVALLSEGVMKTMFLTKLKCALTAGLVIVTAVAGAAFALTGLIPSGAHAVHAAPAPKEPEEGPNEAQDPEAKHGDPIIAAAYSRDGRLLALAQSKNFFKGKEHKILLFETRRWQQVHELRGPTAICFSVAFSADGRTLFAASDDGFVYSWNTNTGAPGLKLDAKAGQCRKILLSPDGKFLVTGHHDVGKNPTEGTIHIWDAATGKFLHHIAASDVGAHMLTFTPDGKSITEGFNSFQFGEKDFNGVIEWDLATGKEQKRFNAVRITPGAFPITHAISYTRDGKKMLVGGGEAVPVPGQKDTTMLHGYLWLFDRETGKLEKTLITDRQDYVRMLLQSPDGSRLYLPTYSENGESGELQCWDTSTWALKWTRESDRRYWALITSPNGKRIATATGKGFHFFDPQTGEPKGGLVECDE
jgi:RNA polymerase sigma factor (sigma-70 family)